MTRNLVVSLIVGQIAADLAFIAYIWLNQTWANRLTETVANLLSRGAG